MKFCQSDSTVNIVTKLPNENVWGHRKKLDYILNTINKFKRDRRTSNKLIRVLDFGCGNGSAVSQFLIGAEIDFHGVDLHGPSLTYAREHFGGSQAHFHDKIPKGMTFDIIIYADVLEHLNHPKIVLAEHTALLADNGIVIGAIPNGYGPFEIESWVDRRLRLTQILYCGIRTIKYIIGKHSHRNTIEIPYNNESGHIQFFTKQALLSLIKQVNLDIIDF